VILDYFNASREGRSFTFGFPHRLAEDMARQTQTRSSATSTPQTTKSTPKRSPRNAANKKSKYFESASEQEDSSFDDDNPLSSESEPTATDTDDDEPPKKKSKTTPKKGVNKVTKQTTARRRTSKAKDVESEEEPWETFVPKDSTPEVGDVPYKNHTIHPNTMKFLEGYGVLCITDGRFSRKQ
jgi:hypothetical protein